MTGSHPNKWVSDPVAHDPAAVGEPRSGPSVGRARVEQNVTTPGRNTGEKKSPAEGTPFHPPG